ncbi:cell division protein ZipA isoform X4 [Rhipicephalus sanguineus]|uniref:cell division protein ZipA isoform X4 n=1 Tax=Rhipicephalus sanguineus TaxID=34632 RepID=UPI00189547D2|nr:cell division protein ZipA isoform X4 [Rhipicephalus sanguineus]
MKISVIFYSFSVFLFLCRQDALAQYNLPMGTAPYGLSISNAYMQRGRAIGALKNGLYGNPYAGPAAVQPIAAAQPAHPAAQPAPAQPQPYVFQPGAPQVYVLQPAPAPQVLLYPQPLLAPQPLHFYRSYPPQPWLQMD